LTFPLSFPPVSPLPLPSFLMNNKDVEGACRYLPAGFFYSPSQFKWNYIKEKNSMDDDLVAEVNPSN
ncbi:hypothetical protein ACEF17_11055, partial [Streptococcus hyovaginalis]